MTPKRERYRAIVSSDWNECLAPCGPFDFISSTYPSLKPQLFEIFKEYTGNAITLSEATRRIGGLLPAPVTEEQMDAYLDEFFTTYKGVPELINWCLSRDILFMINTTGMQGYFQRVFEKGLMPKVPIISAHPMIRYPERGGSRCRWYDLLEIEDKAENTRAVVRAWEIPHDKIVLIGDSGGDGPHFRWGAKAGVFLVGSMTKGSLEIYCRKAGIPIHHRFGVSYSEGEERDLQKEMAFDFMELAVLMERWLAF